MTRRIACGPLRLLCGGLFYAVVAWLSCVGSARAAAPSLTTTQLRVEPGPGVSSEWKVGRASVSESFQRIEVDAAIRSVAARPISAATFYGELYDASGRLCFTTLFSLATNRQGAKGPVRPGGARVLYSESVQMGVATRPRLMRFYLIRQTPPSSHGRENREAQRVLSPPIVMPTNLAGAQQWYRLCLGGTGVSSTAPVVDVALGLADVEPTGELGDFQVLDALGTWPFSAWAELFAAHLRFRPAHLGNKPVAAKTLILFRVVLREWKKGDPPYLPRSNPWVRSYMESFSGKQAPVIAVIQLDRCHGASPSGPKGGNFPCFKYNIVPYWSLGIGVAGQ